MSHAGSALLAQVADKTGLTQSLSAALGEPGLRAGSHDRGRVICDLAVMLADSGDCLADLRAVGDQAALFGAVASTSTAFRVIDRIASTPGLLDALRGAHARARERFWELAGAPPRLTIDLDATPGIHAQSPPGCRTRGPGDPVATVLVLVAAALRR